MAWKLFRGLQGPNLVSARNMALITLCRQLNDTPLHANALIVKIPSSFRQAMMKLYKKCGATDRQLGFYNPFIIRHNFKRGLNHGNGYEVRSDGSEETPEAALHRIRTAGSISISPELFEKLYLTPQNAVKGDLRKTFGNPSPLGLVGFVMCLTPLSCDLMGWRGAGGAGGGAASTGVYVFMGGVLLLISGVLEFFLGNTFPYVVFCSFGGFWLSFGATLIPSVNASGAYSSTGINSAEGVSTPAFLASFAFYVVFWGLLGFIFLICSLRTNVEFVAVFVCVVASFGLLAGSYWQAANGAYDLAHNLQVAGGATLFVCSLCAWYILLAQMLAALDFPFQIPVGDLSTMIKGASQKGS